MAEENNGGVSGFFKKIGKKFDDATFDMRMVSDFTKTHKKYTVYSGTSVLAASPEIAVEEFLEQNYIVTVDDDEQIAAGNLIENNENGEVRHIEAVEKTTLTLTFEGKAVEKPALKITLGDLAEKVEVIKVGNDYYLK